MQSQGCASQLPHTCSRIEPCVCAGRGIHVPCRGDGMQVKVHINGISKGLVYVLMWCVAVGSCEI